MAAMRDTDYARAQGAKGCDALSMCRRVVRDARAAAARGPGPHTGATIRSKQREGGGGQAILWPPSQSPRVKFARTARYPL
jgi:hypothetical protein